MEYINKDLVDIDKAYFKEHLLSLYKLQSHYNVRLDNLINPEMYFILLRTTDGDSAKSLFSDMSITLNEHMEK